MQLSDVTHLDTNVRQMYSYIILNTLNVYGFYTYTIIIIDNYKFEFNH